MLNTEIDERWARKFPHLFTTRYGASWPISGFMVYLKRRNLGNPTRIFHQQPISEVAPPIESHRMDNFQIFLELLQQKAARLAMKAGA